MLAEEAAATATEVPAAAEEAEAKPAKAKKAPKEKKEKKPATARKPLAHPPYAEGRDSRASGSTRGSRQSTRSALASSSRKYVEEKHGAKLLPNFRKLLAGQLKKLAAAGKLTRVKNSFKLAAAGRELTIYT
ncbi:histone H1-like [Panicum virgatum]|uniref:histone H1-like n=1 Tax=Panicum virgatum TaxID=38727 RepID=UPI0019D53FCC|nr:histone H1-like [Panicum virgatum]